MACAMVEGWLRAGIPAASITACGPNPKATPDGVRFTQGVPSAAPDILLLGMKPQALAAAAPGLQPVVRAGTTVISILAGVELATLTRHFPGAAGVVRLMPNLAAAIGKSPCALVATGLSAERRAEVTRLAEALGAAEWLADENLFDLVTALAGSGPGFVYRFIDALATAGADLGLAPDQARRLAVQMTEGAAMLAAASADSPAALADKVASPGGMTRRGLDVLDADGALVKLVTETLRAARDRGREMADAARGEG
ncbi:pyrroline-5-carboxylate reductase [Altererythrobacter aerius]|uniref:Pyrroline-5-carboxylate reductase n=2 Tax=Tsuneonella aeria TaxID=1837929 RepID=A0A6I4TCS9_9SPHN|nr:pyrroline-5-carboxylate reductase dimerization domain-containing protein [Tsuneonella aeria]MXO74574.1 pyrroline-5-carboxylate reductase [Tsuneonella aeria]